MKRIVVVMLLLAGIAGGATATEGMWMPSQLPQIAAELKSAGLELDPNNLTELTEFPMGAIVSLGGCSASFVSPKGLVVTNHHCIYGSIQYNSTPERNLIEDGFLARTLADEVSASPGSRVYVTVGVDDVTKQVIDPATADLDGKARIDSIEANEKALVAKCEADEGHRCDVYSFYRGESYFLIKRMEIRDVRLVHAPALGVGKFGGDTDNWMWPRHTGDYGFYRAYVGPDGRPADFDEANVPFKPEHYLKLADRGVEDGDFVMIAGYPGSTNRHRLPSEVEHTFGWNYPAFVKLTDDILNILERETAEREAAAIKYASYKAGVANYNKNRKGMLDSYAKSDFLARKQKLHSDLIAWVNASSKHRKTYGPSIERIEALLAERQQISKQEMYLNYSYPRLLNTAKRLYRLAHERQKADLERKTGYQQRDEPRLKQGLQSMERRYDGAVDRAFRTHFLAQYLAQPKAERDQQFDAALGLRDGMSLAEIDTLLSDVYQGSELDQTPVRLRWMDASIADFKASEDRFIQLAVALHDHSLALEERDEELAGDIQQAYGGYMAALKAYLQSVGKPVYPDANSTLRITFGEVTGRSAGLPDGTSWTPFTTLDGIVAKHTGEGEFDAPAEQLAAIERREFANYASAQLNSVPVNFLATLDITGGNSGSAVLNSKAELVGLAFDGTLDSIISDWDYNDATTRTIAVDLRYMLWQMQVVDKASELLQELGVR